MWVTLFEIILAFFSRQLAGAVANGPWVEKTGKDFDVTLVTM